MTKIDIFSGFLGAGKTTLIKKLIAEAFVGQKVVLIENEFGEIGIDGGFLQEAGIQITEINSGCICCSLVGDFSAALKKVMQEYAPDRIVIEPSGVGKLSDVIRAVERAELENAVINSFTTVVDAKKCKMYLKNFGEFFGDQIDHAACIALSHTDLVTEDKLAECVELLKNHNAKCTIITTDWKNLSGKQIMDAMEHTDTLDRELKELEKEMHHRHGEECDDPDCACHEHHHEREGECGCHEHHHDHEGECGCHEHHHEREGECGCHEHHHDHEGECVCHEHHHEHEGECGCHEHHHDHEEECGCHEHHHEHGHRHDHHADEVFVSFGRETAKTFTKEALKSMLDSLEDEEKYGAVLRAKGIVKGVDGWLHFDYVPGESDVRSGCADVTGKLCVIGCKLNERALEELFGL